MHESLRGGEPCRPVARRAAAFLSRMRPGKLASLPPTTRVVHLPDPGSPTNATDPFKLTDTAGALASSFHAKAITATLRRQLITIAARVTRSARRSYAAAARRLALGRRLAAAVHRRDRATRPSLNPFIAPEAPGPQPPVETPSRSATRPRPQHTNPTARINYMRSTRLRGASGLGEELLELDRAMLPVRRADHRSVGGVERREQAGRAVADVVVGPLLGHALVINYRSAQFCRTRKQVNRLRPAQFRG